MRQFLILTAFLSGLVNVLAASSPADTNSGPDIKIIYDSYKSDAQWPTFAVNLLIPGFGNFGWGSALQGDSYGSELEFKTTVIGIGTGGLLWVLSYYLPSAWIGNLKTFLETGGPVIMAGGVAAGYGMGLARPFIYESEHNRKLRKDLGLPADAGLNGISVPLASVSF